MVWCGFHICLISFVGAINMYFLDTAGMIIYHGINDVYILLFFECFQFQVCFRCSAFSESLHYIKLHVTRVWPFWI